MRPKNTSKLSDPLPLVISEPKGLLSFDSFSIIAVLTRAFVFSMDRFLRQHEHIEQLNIQAHHSALTKHDEFVVEYLVSHEKVGRQSRF